MFQVLCNSGGLTEIPAKLLPDTVEHLSLTKNNFPIIKTDAFAGLRALKKLSLDGNNISVIKPFAFRGLPRLRELSIQHTPLQAVGSFAFAGLQNITSILLSYNQIKMVEQYAFAGTSNVRWIKLNNNPMQKVNTSAFTGLTNVEHIIFPSGIRTIEPDAFTGMDTIGLIKLAFMDLKALKPYTFRGLSKVHILSIQESDLGVIQTDAFDGLTYVTNLNFLNNKIDAIQDLTITFEHHIRAIKMQGNHLLETPAIGAITFHGVEVLTIYNNHFPCDCHIHNLISGPLANGSADEFMSRNYCISPLEVNGKAMKELDLESIGRCQEQVTRENLEASKTSNSASMCVQTNQIVNNMFCVLVSVTFKLFYNIYFNCDTSACGGNVVR